MYIIVKSTRRVFAAAYRGPTWDAAGLRSRFKEKYQSREEAEQLAEALSQHNLVGFTVVEIKEQKQ